MLFRWQGKTTSIIPLSLMMTLAWTVQAQVKPAATIASSTWHVAPEQLKGILPAIQLRTIASAAAKPSPVTRY